jgi:imidazolonepropionase-like amidohydrolase
MSGSPPLSYFRFLAPALLLALGVVACDAADEAREAPADQTDDPSLVTAFRNVSIIDTQHGDAISGQTVLVRDSHIDVVGPAETVEIPAGAKVIDGAGHYLMPGMAEMHGHLPPADASNPILADILFLYVANGVTLVRGMQGHVNQIEVRNAIEAGELLGPRLVLGSPAMGWGNAPPADEAAEKIREFREAGFDLIKIGEGLDREAYQALREAAATEGLPLAGHVPDEVGLLSVLEARQVTIDHLDNYVEELVPEDKRAGIAPLWGVASVTADADPDRIAELVEATVASGAAQVPTMVLWETFFGDVPAADIREATPETRYLPPEAADAWEQGLTSLRETIGHPEGARRVVELRRDIFRALHEGGAEFLLGTDSPQLFSVPGFSNHREMALWVELGMSSAEVIRAGTWNVARHFDELDVAGSVAEGRRADLILLESNPLDDIAALKQARAGVMMRGQWLPEAEIRERLEAIAQR